MALSKITTASLSDDSVDTAQIADDAIESAQLANNVAISTSGAITTTGAFTSVGIDDNADATTMTIDTSENVGIGNTSPSSQYMTRLVVGDGSGTEGITIYSGNDSSGRLEFSDATSGDGRYAGGIVYEHNNNKLRFNTNGGNERLGIDSSGNVTINAGNLVMSNGKGIDFSAQTGCTALSSGDGTENPTTENEVLKHYEHGTFKPKVVSSGATFDYQGSGGQYGSGHYTRIGDIVFIDINLDSDGGVSGTTSNSVQIQNLPFTGHTGTSMNVQYFYRRVSSSTYPHIMAQQYDNYISFLQSPDSGQWRSLPASNISFSDHRMKISGCYHIGTV